MGRIGGDGWKDCSRRYRKERLKRLKKQPQKNRDEIRKMEAFERKH